MKGSKRIICLCLAICLAAAMLTAAVTANAAPSYTAVTDWESYAVGAAGKEQIDILGGNTHTWNITPEIAGMDGVPGGGAGGSKVLLLDNSGGGARQNYALELKKPAGVDFTEATALRFWVSTDSSALISSVKLHLFAGGNGNRTLVSPVSGQITQAGGWMEYPLDNTQGKWKDNGYNSGGNYGSRDITADDLAAVDAIRLVLTVPASVKVYLDNVEMAQDDGGATEETTEGTTEPSSGEAEYTAGGTFYFQELAITTANEIDKNFNDAGKKVVNYKPTGIGDYMEFTIPGIQAGKYTVVINQKFFTGRGRYQLSYNGVNIGDPVDFYGTGVFAYKDYTFGVIDVAENSDVTLRLTVEGKHNSSTGYGAILQYVQLTPHDPTATTVPTTEPTKPTLAPTPKPEGTVAATSLFDFENDKTTIAAGADTTYKAEIHSDPAHLAPGSTKGQKVTATGGGVNATMIKLWQRENLAKKGYDGIRIWLQSGTGEEETVSFKVELNDYAGTYDLPDALKKTITITPEGGWYYLDCYELGVSKNVLNYTGNIIIDGVKPRQINGDWANWILWVDDIQAYTGDITAISEPSLPSGEVEQEQISVQVKDGNVEIAIANGSTDNQYQLWALQEVTVEEAEGQSKKAQIWTLVQGYTAGSTEGFLAIISAADLGKDKNGNYQIMVQVKNGSGEQTGQFIDVVTPEEAGELVLTKVLVNGKVAGEKVLAESGSKLELEAVAQGATEYRVTGPGSVTKQDDGKYEMDLSNVKAGEYGVTVTASNGGETVTKALTLEVYGGAQIAPYIQKAEVSGSGESVNVSVTAQGEAQYEFGIAEPGRSVEKMSGSAEQALHLGEGKYGIYQIQSYVKGIGAERASDAYMNEYQYERAGRVEVTLDANKESVSKNEAVEFSAEGTIENLGEGETIEYSYWRQDAKGWTLLKDWSQDGSLTWKPAMAGTYILEVRIKGSEAGSYEDRASCKYVVNAEDMAAQGNLKMSVSQAGASGTTVEARKPVEIKMEGSDEVLYQVVVSREGYDEMIESAYGPKRTVEWIPEKPGTYKVKVAIRSAASYGYADAYVETEVTAQ